MSGDGGGGTGGNRNVPLGITNLIEGAGNSANDILHNHVYTGDSYGGELTAPLNATQQAGGRQLINSAFNGGDAINRAISATTGLLSPGGTPTVSAQTVAGNTAQSAPDASSLGGLGDLHARDLYDPGLLDRYINPYTNNVVNTTLSDLDLQRRRAINGNSSNATAAGGEGAWGGSRAGVSDALTNEGYARQSADSAAQLRQAGFNAAAGLEQSDADRNLQQQQAQQATNLARDQTLYGGLLSQNQHNQDAFNTLSAGNADLQLRAAEDTAGYGDAGLDRALQAGAQLGALGGQQQAHDLAGANAVIGVGNQQQQAQQAADTANFNNFQNVWNDVYKRLGAVTSTYGGSTPSYGNPQATSPLSAIGSGLSTAAAIGGK